jgi:hypothetical protein
MAEAKLGSRVAIFRGSLERFNLWLAFAFLPWVIFDLFHPMDRTSEAKGILNLIAAFVFLDCVHAVFTFALLLLLPEFQSWANSRIRSVRLTWGQIASLGMIITLIFGLLFHPAFSRRLAADWSRILFIPFVTLQGIHALGQVRGLSAMYNVRGHAALEYTNEERTKIQRHERIERKLFQSITLVLIGVAVLSFWSNLTLGWLSIRSIAIGLSAALVLNAFLTPKSNCSNKRSFIWRVFFITLSVGGFSPAAGLASRSLHGIEYFCVCEKLASNSKRRFSNSVLIGLFVMMFIVAAISYFPISREVITFQLSKPIYRICFALAFFRTYAHYFLDAILFRFQNADVKRTVGPLLLEKASATQSV